MTMPSPTLAPIERLLPASTSQPVWRRAGIRALEAALQARCPHPLMDLAGQATARLAMAIAPHARRIWILAGPGNNGGDGLEAARILHQYGVSVRLYWLGTPQALPVDAQRAHQRVRQCGVEIHSGLPSLDDQPDAGDLCIDALLGIGASRPPQGILLQAVRWLNASRAAVLSIDIPTGLDCDSGQMSGAPDSCVRASHTLTFLGVKPGLLMGSGRDVCGVLWLASLGAGAALHGRCPPDAWIHPPPPARMVLHASHKGSHGDVLVVGGQSAGPRHPGMSGAAILAAQSALHAGAGRVWLCLLGQDKPCVPADLMHCDLDSLPTSALTVVAGCGGGQAIATPLGRLLEHSTQLVMDADALNHLARDSWLESLLIQRQRHKQATILTPHPLEAARLLKCSTQDVQADRLGAAGTLAERFGCVVVLKGSGSVIAAPGRPPHINTTGNGRLAIAGTGDVLAGLTGALLSRLLDPWQAACEAVYRHGLLADRWPAGQALTASRLSQALT